jgi:YD repeat-containing protein
MTVMAAILALPGQAYAYNAKNELVHLTAAGGVVADYTYDHLGVRMSRRVDDGHGHVVRTLFVGDQAEVRNGIPVHFVKLGPMRVAILTSGSVSYVHENSVGTTAFLTDAAGHEGLFRTVSPAATLRSARFAGGRKHDPLGHPFLIDRDPAPPRDFGPRQVCCLVEPIVVLRTLTLAQAMLVLSESSCLPACLSLLFPRLGGRGGEASLSAPPSRLEPVQLVIEFRSGAGLPFGR